MSQHSESPEEDPDFQNLEEKLAQLKPAGPSDAFTRRLSHQIDAMERDRAEKKVVWVRFAPVAAAALVVLTSTFLFRGYLLQKQAAGADRNSETETFDSMVAKTADSGPAPVIDDEATSPLGNGGPSGFFLPAAKGNFILSAENAGMIGTRDDGMPAREWKLGFDDTEHWKDPETGTNLRFFIPRQEFFWVPVAID